jgi:hypothetical protein
MPQYGGYQQQPAGLPSPVNVSSILLFIAGGFAVLGGLLLLSVGGRVSGIFVAAGAVSLVLGGIEIYVGVALRQLKPWARMGALILAGIGVLLQLLSLFGGNVVSVVGLVLDLLIIYFMFRPETLAAFQPGPR